MVNFVIGQDRARIFRFAPLQSTPAKAALDRAGLNPDSFDSFVLISGEKSYLYSTAALKVMALLPWYWQWTRVFWIIPASIRDAVYRYVARNRYRWFGKKDQCMVPSSDVRDRFL